MATGYDADERSLSSWLAPCFAGCDQTQPRWLCQFLRDLCSAAGAFADRALGCLSAARSGQDNLAQFTIGPLSRV
jgi:hypothetical protein